ncbi:hypothetical protein RHMOL_Rhmol04G0318900 [Rhododendron molle]|uniref:Uncharacterized protein n=1 Tax=Rhododendron molle TaxID=49168 RepID=A0ACC0P6M0_RHOML|nr:hypothetical protein RHMOL_Rhmol04G0318900 [Rhododendron molle]
MFLQDAGIGTSIASFYEYLLKQAFMISLQAYLLFGDEECLFIFQEAYEAAMRYLYTDPWYVEVNMNSAALVWPLFNSLQAFWPGLQVLAGDIDPAIRTHAAFFSVWKRYGFTPEGFNLATLSVQHGQKSYPLRPELIESTYWLYKATRDPRYLDAGRDMVASLQYGARCTCGYCHISDVEFHKQEDHMESFFLAETCNQLGAGGMVSSLGVEELACSQGAATFRLMSLLTMHRPHKDHKFQMSLQLQLMEAGLAKPKQGAWTEVDGLCRLAPLPGSSSFGLRRLASPSVSSEAVHHRRYFRFSSFWQEMDKVWLHQLFGGYGQVDDIYIPLKRSAKFNTKFGFICFLKREEALNAVHALDGIVIRDFKLQPAKSDNAAAGPDNLVENGPYKYLFSTEGHLLPATPQISLVHEHCSYFGAYCISNHSRQKSYTSDISTDSLETNSTRLCRGPVSSSFVLDSSSQKSTSVSGLIKGVCPGLTHGQKFGISYVASPTDNDASSNESKTAVVQNHPVVVVASPAPQYQKDVQNDHDTNDKESSEAGSRESPTSKSVEGLAVDLTFER